MSTAWRGNIMSVKGWKKREENSWELKNNYDIPQFLSPCLLFHYVATTQTQCQRDFTAKICLCYRMWYRLDTCDRVRHTHTHTQTQAHIRKHARTSITQLKTGSKENLNQKWVNSRRAGRRAHNEIITGKYWAIGATTVCETERLC